MSYINKKEYEKLINYAPSGISKDSITRGLIARGHKIQGLNDQEKKTFGGQLLKDIASPFVKGTELITSGARAYGGVLKAGYQSATGDNEAAQETIKRTASKIEDRNKKQVGSVFGDYNPITSKKEAIGTAIEGFSTIYGGGAARSVAQAGLKGALKSAVKTGVKSGVVSGFGFGAGREMQNDGEIGDVIKSGLVSGAIGGVGGGLLGGIMFGGNMATKSIYRSINKKLQPVTEQAKDKITQYISKAIKPSTAGKTSNQLQKIQGKQVEAFQVLKNNVKDIKLTNDIGEKVSRTPKTVRELVSSIDDVKVKLFSRYDRLAREAGEKGANFNPIKTVSQLEKLSTDKAYSPSLRKYSKEVLSEIAELQGESPLIVQSRIKELNESLAGYFAGRVEKGRARIDASVAKALNEELDDVIFNFTGGQWKQLRGQFSALKSLEKDATRAAQRIANRQAKGLGDLTDIFTGGDLISGVLTMNPAQATRGALGKGIQMYYKHINNPDRYIRKIFEELDNPLLNKLPIKPTTPLKTKGETLPTKLVSKANKK